MYLKPPVATMQLDVILAEHLAEKFNAELGAGSNDVRKNSKAMAKLIRQARLLIMLQPATSRTWADGSD